MSLLRRLFLWLASFFKFTRPGGVYPTRTDTSDELSNLSPRGGAARGDDDTDDDLSPPPPSAFARIGGILMNPFRDGGGPSRANDASSGPMTLREMDVAIAGVQKLITKFEAELTQQRDQMAVALKKYEEAKKVVAALGAALPQGVERLEDAPIEFQTAVTSLNTAKSACDLTHTTILATQDSIGKWQTKYGVLVNARSSERTRVLERAHAPELDEQKYELLLEHTMSRMERDRDEHIEVKESADAMVDSSSTEYARRAVSANQDNISNILAQCGAATRNGGGGDAAATLSLNAVLASALPAPTHLPGAHPPAFAQNVSRAYAVPASRQPAPASVMLDAF